MNGVIGGGSLEELAKSRCLALKHMSHGCQNGIVSVHKQSEADLMAMSWNERRMQVDKEFSVDSEFDSRKWHDQYRFSSRLSNG